MNSDGIYEIILPVWVVIIQHSNYIPGVKIYGNDVFLISD